MRSRLHGTGSTWKTLMLTNRSDHKTHVYTTVFLEKREEVEGKD